MYQQLYNHTWLPPSLRVKRKNDCIVPLEFLTTAASVKHIVRVRVYPVKHIVSLKYIPPSGSFVQTTSLEWRSEGPVGVNQIKKVKQTK